MEKRLRETCRFVNNMILAARFSIFIKFLQNCEKIKTRGKNTEGETFSNNKIFSFTKINFRLIFSNEQVFSFLVYTFWLVTNEGYSQINVK